MDKFLTTESLVCEDSDGYTFQGYPSRDRTEDRMSVDKGITLDTILENSSVTSGIPKSIDCSSSSTSKCTTVTKHTTDTSQYSTASKSSRAKRAKNSSKSFQITAFPDEANPIYLQPDTYGWDRGVILSWAAQFEDCPQTGKLHFHVFVQFKHKQVWDSKLIQIRDVLDKVSLESIVAKGKGTVADARAGSYRYCSRMAKRKEGTLCVQFGLVPKGSKKVKEPVIKTGPVFRLNAKRQAANDLIDAEFMNKTWAELYVSNQAILRDDRSAEKYYQMKHSERWVNLDARKLEKVVFFWGAAGSGKSTLAKAPVDYKTRLVEETQKEFRKRVWVQGSDMGDFWGAAGSECLTPDHDVIIVDEMGPKHSFSLKQNSKRISNTGHYGVPVGIKGSSVRMNAHTMIFTSNVDPRYWSSR